MSKSLSKDVSPEILEKLYTSVLRIRLIEEAIVEEYPKQEIKSPTHLHIGQEAVPAGVCAALNKDDFVYGYYRSHGWFLAKGGNFQGMMDELYGSDRGCSRGYGGSMHLIDLDAGFTGTTAIVSAAMPHAVGAAFSFKYNKTQQVAVTCFGDGATEEGIFPESLMFAALRKLPVIFICENNGLATNTLIAERQPPVAIYKRAEAQGVPSFLVDGNNALEVYAVAKEAVARARRGDGPTFIECTTYRYLEHCGHLPDFHLGHRTEAEIAEWKKKDPLPFLEAKVSKDLAKKLREQIAKEIEQTFETAKKAPRATQLIPAGLEF